jgi:hypothetical protein
MCKEEGAYNGFNPDEIALIQVRVKDPTSLNPLISEVVTDDKESAIYGLEILSVGKESLAIKHNDKIKKEILNNVEKKLEELV